MPAAPTKTSRSKNANGHSKSAPQTDHAARLFNGRFQTGVGVYDGLSALLAEKWHFDFVWISSFCCSAAVVALCIQDNPISKRCSLYDGYDRDLVSVEEHIARLRAALAGVKAAGSNARIIARTEALVAGMGVKEALRRATAYADAGADAVFIQSLDATGNEVLSFAREWKRRTKALHCR